MVKPIETEEPTEYFDEHEFVQREIDPLLAEIHRKCSERNIPCIFLVESSNDEENITESCGGVLPRNRKSPRMKVLATLLRDDEAVAKMGMLAAALMENDDEHL